MKIIKKILVANRGEIAIRVMRTAKDMGIATVAIYSDADKDALFVAKADEAICIGGTYASESYLLQDKIIAAAKQTGADAIHPGYGFLSENASFSKRCADEGVIFIGPSEAAIIAMGSKIGAKELMKKAGVPVVPGYNGDDQHIETLKKEASKIGYPILLKASAGGGGKGMRIVNNEQELQSSIEAASREAEKSFGDGRLLMEKYFASAKHIEFQIFGDNHGNCIHLFERECSLQRRYQKVIEESPSPSLTDSIRKKMGDAAVAAAKSINYTNAGTVEFIYIPYSFTNTNNDTDKQDGAFYFLEVNTRLQVEHPVTEETAELDLVKMQIEVAQGLPLSINQTELKQTGHAIECRICAEDPENNFFPSTGKILYWTEPQLKGLRYDSGVQSLSEVNVFYDSLISKVISWGSTRTEAIGRMLLSLNSMSILGITTNKDFLKELLQHPSFVDGSFHTKLIERDYSNYKKNVKQNEINESAIALVLFDWHKRKKEQTFANSLNGWRNLFYQPNVLMLEYSGNRLNTSYRYLQNNTFFISISQQSFSVELIESAGNSITVIINNHRKIFSVAVSDSNAFVQVNNGNLLQFKIVPRFAEPGNVAIEGGYTAPMPGEIVKVLVKPGDVVKQGKGLLVMNSMKMETTIEAHTDGEVEDVFVSEKTFVEANKVLLKMK